MQKNSNRKALIFILLILLLSFYGDVSAQPKRAKTKKAAAADVKAVLPDIAYTISMPKPHTHLLEVEMKIKWPQMPPQFELKMPVWTPGSYMIREYARHVQSFAAKDAAGNVLGWRKINKNTWQVDSKGVNEIAVTYQVYSNELTVRTNELNDEHAFWNNTALLLFPKGQLNAPSIITVNPHGAWRIATGLPKVEGRTNTFRAENFDVLYDAPFEVSDFREVSFTVQGKPHRFVFSGDGNYDLNKIAEDTAKIIEECYKIFGELPYNDYTFIVNLRGGGGLEHLNSTALQWNRFGFKPQARAIAFLNLVAHEFFHLWNVKRIRPDALGPFDYENENYTKLLWVAEGGTSYYEGVLLRRAGLISDKEVLSTKAGLIQQLQERHGRFETSIEEASFDAWIKFYRQDENSINNQISYYDKGDIVSMMLDIAIRTASGGTKSLDDVMRHLNNEFFKKGKNYTPEDFQKAAELAAGKSLDDFFAKHVRRREEIDYNAIANGIGLQLMTVELSKGRPFFGADLVDEAGRVNVRSIPAGTPAYEQGINTGDQIVAVDGYRVAGNAFLQTYINEKKPGDKIRLTIFRFDRLREIDFTLGTNPRKEYGFIPVNSPTEEQKRLYREYLNAELQ